MMDTTRKHYALYCYSGPLARYVRVGRWLTRKAAQTYYDKHLSKAPYPDCLHAIVYCLPADQPTSCHAGTLLYLQNGITWLKEQPQ
jgi:hypothetical protein